MTDQPTREQAIEGMRLELLGVASDLEAAAEGGGMPTSRLRICAETVRSVMAALTLPPSPPTGVEDWLRDLALHGTNPEGSLSYTINRFGASAVGNPRVSLDFKELQEAVRSMLSRSSQPTGAELVASKPDPVLYWLEEGKFARAMRYGKTEAGDLLIVDLTTGDGPSVVDRPDWFGAGYVAAYGGLVPECAKQGKEPGQWDYGVARLPNHAAEVERLRKEGREQAEALRAASAQCSELRAEVERLRKQQKPWELCKTLADRLRGIKRLADSAIKAIAERDIAKAEVDAGKQREQALLSAPLKEWAPSKKTAEKDADPATLRGCAHQLSYNDSNQQVRRAKWLLLQAADVIEKRCGTQRDPSTVAAPPSKPADAAREHAPLPGGFKVGDRVRERDNQSCTATIIGPHSESRFVLVMFDSGPDSSSVCAASLLELLPPAEDPKAQMP